MATLAEIATMTETHTLLKTRFMGGLIKAAWDVINESGATDNHANRIALARKVMLDAKSILNTYYVYMLSNATIQTSAEDSTDNDIQFVVNSFYDIIANLEAA